MRVVSNSQNPKLRGPAIWSSMFINGGGFPRFPARSSNLLSHPESLAELRSSGSARASLLAASVSWLAAG